MYNNRKPEINREKDCPFLIKIYWKENDYHKFNNFIQRLNLFEQQDPELKKSEIQIYSWRDTTLKEIVDQLKINISQAQDINAKFRFSSVYKDPRGNFKRKDLGTFRNYRESRDDQLTLQDLRFFVGDIMDLTIMTLPELNK